MRRVLPLLGLLVTVLAACGSTPSGSSTDASAPSATPPAAASAATSVMAGASAMTEHSMSGEAMSGSTEVPGQEPVGTMSGAQMSDHAMAETAEPAITVRRSDFGLVLFDATGQAIYLFDKDNGARPDCYDQCAVAWPPVLTTGGATAGTGVNAGLLATTPRTDGTIQVTYAGHPLYFYTNEGKDQVTCNNVNEFGGVWLSVTPTGDPVKG
jgi:predicted lipoprotein with Yx(FWY)xxD motif